jgi:hypothetical protein
MRAVVYGMLAAVAALVLAARPSAGGSEPARADTYIGYAGRGARLNIIMEGRRFRSLALSGTLTCRGRRTALTWSPTAEQANVRYTRRGSEFAVHEWPDPRFTQPPGARIHMYLSANLNWDVHRIDGAIRYVDEDARGKCGFASVPFGVSRR